MNMNSEYQLCSSKNKQKINKFPDQCLSQCPFVFCIHGHSKKRNLTGMAIADITLLSGFEAKMEDLDKVGILHHYSHYKVREDFLDMCKSRCHSNYLR